MKKVKEFFPQIFGGIASGLLVAIGGTVLLSVDDRYIGAILFTVALLAICVLDLYLFTGRIGFVAESYNKKMPAQLAVGLLGNFIGATLTGFIVRFARPAIVEKAAAACQTRLDNGLMRAFVLGCLCGVLMYVAVKMYKCGSVLGIVFCIPVFILSGFEHSIADMFYFALAAKLDLAYLAFIVAVILGNAVGAMAIASLWRLKNVSAK